MEDFKARLQAEFAPFGALTDMQLAQLEQHYVLLLRWNQKINLTRITELEDAVRHHYCESLYLASKLPPKPLKIIDIGSGAGFPGIPVAVYRPDCSVELVESNQRKAVFLTESMRLLGLCNVQVSTKRAEQLSGPYDCVVSRAVRPGDVLSLGLAPDVFILSNSGEKLPWGKDRYLFHVERKI